jgi:hypothetical protein
VTGPSTVERYLRLGLELGRHVDGIVDSYCGPPELADAVDAEPPVDPRALVSTAEAPLDELAHGWLQDPELAAHVVRFLGEPTSRTYIVTYPAGRELCRAYVAGDPERLRRLLTEQVRVRDLLDPASSAGDDR